MNETAGQVARLEELLGQTRIIPVLVIEHDEHALRLGETLLDAGLRVIEVTLRTASALAVIESLARSLPQLVVGAGSVLDGDQLRRVETAGARFAVCPGSEASLLTAAEDAGIPLIPGAATASEVLQLRRRGFGIQKFFPAEPAGGVPALKSLAGPIGDVRFMPTGGITATSAADYLALGNVCCIGGSWMVPAAALTAGDFKTIGELARAAAAI